ncbi:MAG: DNA-methyltransferase [Pirellulaceae bacterium]
MASVPKIRAPRNRTLQLTEDDRQRLAAQLLHLESHDADPPTGIACGDCRQWVTALPRGSVDLLFLDPPYNLAKSFGKQSFSRRSIDEYAAWLDDYVVAFLPLLKSSATIYICSDWLTSQSVFVVADKHFTIRNRISWEREKGRGAKSNWKNNSEDIWFCTVSSDYCFNVNDVKQRRPVIAPYRDADRAPKDWQEHGDGNFRDTHPSNLWTDISVPFWSMPENTDHPTQKSEKLLARLILASSNPGDFVLDPFAGSGTSCVVAKKLGRHYLGIEQDQEFALLGLRRLELANQDSSIQGYRDGVFWPRNTRVS